MAVAPIHFFSPAAERAAEVAALTAQNTAAAAATNPTTVGTFSAVLGQVLAALGPLGLDNTLSNIGAGTTNTAGAGSFTNSLFTLLLLNSAGAGQTTGTPTAAQAAAQQLLVTQLLFGATDNTDTGGFGSEVTAQVTAALAQLPGANSTLLNQLALASTQPNPIVFSASVLAQAFQIGNGTGLPA